MPREYAVRVRRLRTLTVMALPLVAACLVSIGGPGILLTSHSEFSAAVFGQDESKATGALVNAILIVVPFVLSLAWALAWREGHSFTLADRVLVLMSFVSCIGINNPVVQARFWVAVVAITLLASIFEHLWRGFPRVLVPLSLLGLLVVFPFAGIFRYANQSRTFVIGDPIRHLAESGDFDALQQIAAAATYVSDYGHTLGWQSLSAVLFFVPRSLWPGKGVDTGTLLAEEGGLANLNVSAPIWAEGYIDFGWTGVVVYLMLLGFIIRRLTASTASADIGAPIAVLIGIYDFVILRGSLLQAMGVTVVLGALLVFLIRPAVASEPRRAQTLPTSRS